MGLRFYYEKMFPYNEIEHYLTLGGSYPFGKREFGFRWEDSDFWKRNETFTTIDKAKRHMERMEYIEDEPFGTKIPIRFGNIDVFKQYLMDAMPKSIDAGPLYDSIYTQSLDRKDAYTIKPCSIVFDIDIKDYDGSRPCICTKKQSCDLCWISCMRRALIDLVGFLCEFMQFKRVIPLYSGRCGVHVIVFDDRVWKWDDNARLAIVDYLPKSIRVDKGAMKSNHMIKIPFSPHIFTGNLALPILDIHEFLPSKDAINIYKLQSIREHIDLWRRVIKN